MAFLNGTGPEDAGPRTGRGRGRRAGGSGRGAGQGMGRGRRGRCGEMADDPQWLEAQAGFFERKLESIRRRLRAAGESAGAAEQDKQS